MTHYAIVMQQGNNIYSFLLNIHTDRHTFAFIYKIIIIIIIIISSSSSSIILWKIELQAKYNQAVWSVCSGSKVKAIPLHAMEALGGRGGIAPTHSRPRY
jgi:hypothetical protein